MTSLLERSAREFNSASDLGWDVLKPNNVPRRAGVVPGLGSNVGADRYLPHGYWAEPMDNGWHYGVVEIRYRGI